MVVKLLTYYGEEVDIMLIFSPQIPHILSVNLKVSSTHYLKRDRHFRHGREMNHKNGSLSAFD